jgi:hypothetical protein
MRLSQTKRPSVEELKAPEAIAKKLTKALSIAFVIFFVPIRNAWGGL